MVGLERLSGIGPYTARAVAALAFGRPVGAVDTNVRRWLIRRFGITPHATNLELQALADALAAPAASAAEAGAWMHASMEFGARICAVRAPRCGACPVAAGCPSRERSVHVPLPRQAAFGGSSRAVRGAILRALSTAPEHRLPLARLRPLAAGADLAALLDGLQRDGLAHRSGGVVQLGSAAEPAAATIGP